jgi:hypothetical protein
MDAPLLDFQQYAGFPAPAQLRQDYGAVRVRDCGVRKQVLSSEQRELKREMPQRIRRDGVTA